MYSVGQVLKTRRLKTQPAGQGVAHVGQVSFDDGLAVFDDDMQYAFVLMEGPPGREGLGLKAVCEQVGDAFGHEEALMHDVDYEGLSGVALLVAG